MATYFVSQDGKQLGPFQLQELLEQVKTHRLHMTDYVFDQTVNDWILLADFKPLKEQLRDVKPKAPPPQAQPRVQADFHAEAQQVPAHAPAAKARIPETKTKTAEPKTDSEFTAADWYVLKGENKFGPFSYTEMIKMLQEKLVFEFDFAWCPGFAAWKRVAEVEAFHTERIRKLKDNLTPGIQDVFFRRRYKRVRYGGTVIVHDNNAVWKGHGIEISAGGAGVVMENAMLIPGQTLYLHFKPGDGVPAFNAVCEVVSKQFVNGVREKTTPIRYGLKFKTIAPDAQKVLQEFSRKGTSAA